MDEFDKVHGKFELLFHSAKKGDRRSLIMAKRAATEMKQIALKEFVENNKIVPRILRRIYEFELWMEKAVSRRTKADTWN